MPKHTTDITDITDISRLQRVRPGDIVEGGALVFRNAGHGPGRHVRVLPRGPLGQIMVRFSNPDFDLAVGERELFIELP